MQELKANLPIGIEPVMVANQPDTVEHAIADFMEALWEAIAIVLVVSMVSLGLRAGAIVVVSIPLVLAIVFAAMGRLSIDLQRISLGALIIALGLLVDDAMITIESMVFRLERGDTKEQAAIFAYQLHRLSAAHRHAGHHLPASCRSASPAATPASTRFPCSPWWRWRCWHPGWCRASCAPVAGHGTAAPAEASARRGHWARPMRLLPALPAGGDAGEMDHHRWSRPACSGLRCTAPASSPSNSSRHPTGRSCWWI